MYNSNKLDKQQLNLYKDHHSNNKLHKLYIDNQRKFNNQSINHILFNNLFNNQFNIHKFIHNHK